MELDEGFEFANRLLEDSIKRTLRELNRTTMQVEKIVLVRFNTLREFFDLDDVWERMSNKEREIVMPQLIPQDILELRDAGWSPNYNPETGKSIWTHE